MIGILLILVASDAWASKRVARSLVNVFPFNQEGHEHHDHEHAEHHDHAEHAQSSEQREARRTPPEGDPEFGPPDPFQGTTDDTRVIGINNFSNNGEEQCIDKVVMVDEIEYDDHIECHHSYAQRCHNTYVTKFEPQQEEVCDDNFKKNCFIEYKKQGIHERVNVCHTPLICQGEGPEECRTVHESHCETRFHEHEVLDDQVECKTVQDEKCEDVTRGYTTEKKCTKWPRQECNKTQALVKKYSPESECKKVPSQLCGPSGCEIQPGPEQCFNKTELVVLEVPEETCSLHPQRECRQVTKLSPLLKNVVECVDIPKEVCSRSRINPRKVSKPVVKKWCYIPSVTSGLGPVQQRTLEV